METLRAAEVEFLSEDELITIIPNITTKQKLNFISGSFGPLQANQPVDVPLWLALHMRSKGQCRVVLPKWMDVDYLKQVLESERKEDEYFEPMPFHYLEIANQLLHFAAHDFEQPERIKLLIEDIDNVRQAKVNVGLQVLDGASDGFQLNNISSMEVNRMRQILTNSLQKVYEISSKDDNLL